MRTFVGLLGFCVFFGAAPYAIFTYLPAWVSIPINVVMTSFLFALILSSAGKEQERQKRQARPLSTEELIELMKK